MADSIDTALATIIDELEEVILEPSIAGGEAWKSRIRERLRENIDVIIAISSVPLPDVKSESLGAIAALETPLGFFQNALREIETGNERDGRNQLWQSISYLSAGVSSLLLLIEVS